MIDNYVTTAGRLFGALITTGEVSQSELPAEYLSYMTDSKVEETLNAMVSQEPLSSMVLTIPSSGMLYLIPSASSILLHNHTTYKKRFMRADENLLDVYIDFFMVLLILHAFYGGRNNNIKQRSFLTYDDIVRIMDEQCQAVLKSRDNREKVSGTGLSFIEVAEAWLNFIADKTILEQRGKKNASYKYGRMHRVIHAMREERMLDIAPDAEYVRPTQRLDDIMLNYYLTLDNVASLNELLTELLMSEKEEPDAED